YTTLFRSQADELVAANARDDVGATNSGRQFLRHATQQRVSGSVAALVVHRVKVVDVDVCERERAVVAPRAVQLTLRDILEETTVAEAGQRIGQCGCACV